MGASQAHAWVALGKFCLVDEATAKKSVPLFVQELGRATNPAVRTPLSHCSPSEAQISSLSARHIEANAPCPGIVHSATSLGARIAQTSVRVCCEPAP